MRKAKHDTGTNRTGTEANSCSRRYGKQLRVGVKIKVVALNKVARRVFTFALSHQAPLNF